MISSTLKTAARRIVTALRWEETHTAGQAAKRHPEAWIHFSRIPKIGVNPSNRQHHDPPGVYFYPIKWLLQHMDNRHGQYAVKFPHYFICSLPKAGHGIDLQKVSLRECTELANNNGWIVALNELCGDPTPLKSGPLGDVRPEDDPGRFLWACMDYMANITKERTWLQMLKGVDWIVDHGGIINAGEPHQVIVFNPRGYRVIESGTNKVVDRLGGFGEVLQMLEERFNTKAVWRQKQATLHIEQYGLPLRIKFDSNAYVQIDFHDKKGFPKSFTIPTLHNATSSDVYDVLMGDIIMIARDKAGDGTKPPKEAFTEAWIRSFLHTLAGPCKVKSEPDGKGICYVASLSTPHSSMYIILDLKEPDCFEVEIQVRCDFGKGFVDMPPVRDGSQVPTENPVNLAKWTLERFWNTWKHTMRQHQPLSMSEDVFMALPLLNPV